MKHELRTATQDSSSFSFWLLSSLELSDTTSMSLKCEPSSEPLHKYAKILVCLEFVSGCRDEGSRCIS
jgi:hypothetical protein